MLKGSKRKMLPSLEEQGLAVYHRSPALPLYTQIKRIPAVQERDVVFSGSFPREYQNDTATKYRVGASSLLYHEALQYNPYHRNNYKENVLRLDRWIDPPVATGFRGSSQRSFESPHPIVNQEEVVLPRILKPHGSKSEVPVTEQDSKSKNECKIEGCTRIKQTRGLCKQHGGGSRCKFEGCNKSNQGGGLCRMHGGGQKCSAAGCSKGAQRGGKCHGHGGIRYCKIQGCIRKDRGAGLCSNHGDKLRCITAGCSKLARRDSLCDQHAIASKSKKHTGS